MKFLESITSYEFSLYRGSQPLVATTNKRFPPDVDSVAFDWSQHTNTKRIHKRIHKRIED
jgi:hypothetical protein